MQHITTALLVAVLQFALAIYAVPAKQWPRSPVSSASCTITSLNDLPAAKKACSIITIGDLVVPAGKTLDLTQLKAGTTVVFNGTVTFGYKEWVGPLVSVSGTKVMVEGTYGHVLDGRGAAWWDGLGGNGGKTKPKFFSVHGLNSSTIRGLNIRNTPVHCFSINRSQDLLIDSVTIDNRDGDKGKLGHNTDAFDVGSCTGITVTGATVYNQDDCLAVNSGKKIKFMNSYCSGGHGISIGSVGNRSDNVVQDVLVSGSTIVDSLYGIRIKTIHGATGLVSNITYSDITLDAITKYGIVIEQDYLNGGPTGDPTPGVPIKHVTLNELKGTIAPGGMLKYILCASCSDFKFSNISVVATYGELKESKCTGAPSGITC